MRRALALVVAILGACAPVAIAPNGSVRPSATFTFGASATPSPSPTPSPTPTPVPKVPTLADAIVQTGLALPWDVGFAPDGRMFVTERVGNLLIFESGQPGARRLANLAIPGVRQQGEAGLMSMAFDPAFASNGRLYLCASRMDAGQYRNQVLRFKVEGNGISFEDYVIREGMRADIIHDGCRLKFAPDGKLWVSMGTSGVERLAQDPNSLNGKILRVNADGSIPEDNPTLPGARARTAAFTMGDRNPQGLAFEPGTDRLFEVEHGEDTHDEINLVRPGANYGWPQQEGPGGTSKGYVDPLWSSGSVTIATSGAAFVTGAQWGLWSGSLFVATLKDATLYRFAVSGETVAQAERLYRNKYGRLRSLTLGPDGALYMTTSNGAGDRVVRITASQ